MLVPGKRAAAPNCGKGGQVAKAQRKVRRRRIQKSELSNRLLLEVCEQLMAGEGPTRIAASLSQTHHLDISREAVIPLLREAIRRGFFCIAPPREIEMENLLGERYLELSGRVRVASGSSLPSENYVAAAAVDQLIRILRHLGDRDRRRVHLGLGAGMTTVEIAKRLAARLRKERGLPELALHALTSGFSPDDPSTSPVAFFGYFEDIATAYHGLFAPAVAGPKDYERIKALTGVSDAFRRSGEIDVIVTSLATKEDDHGALRSIMEKAVLESQLHELEDSGWVGDVMYRPYSDHGPIDDTAMVRAMTLFDLPELVRFAATPEKYVILVAAPCGRCDRTKDRALHPLLCEPSLKVWTDVVLDWTTATALLASSNPSQAK